MATTSRASTRTSLQLPLPIEPIKPLASEPCGPQTANLPLPAPTLHLFARASCSKQRQPPQPNLHSPNSRPAVQCNEGFCNAPERSALDLDYKHRVAETSPFRESRPEAIKIKAGKSQQARSVAPIELQGETRAPCANISFVTVAVTGSFNLLQGAVGEGPLRGARTYGRPSGPRNRVSKRSSEKRTAAEKREYTYVRPPRWPCGNV